MCYERFENGTYGPDQSQSCVLCHYVRVRISKLINFLYIIFSVRRPGILPVPVLWIPTWNTETQPPEVIPMREEEFPELEPRGDAPARPVSIGSSDARAVFVAFAVADVLLCKGEIWLRDEELLAVHRVAPFREWE